MDLNNPTKGVSTHEEFLKKEVTNDGTLPSGTTHQVRMHESRMEAALLQEKPRAWRKSFLKLYACIFVGYLCSATNGFDANTFGIFPQTPQKPSTQSNIIRSVLATG
jgi:hypothetical protein